MRIVRELSHPEYKITVFSWNNRYLIKLEQGFLEQTFKIDQLEVTNEEELIKMIDDEFLALALKRFEEMAHSFREAQHRWQ